MILACGGPVSDFAQLDEQIRAAQTDGFSAIAPDISAAGALGPTSATEDWLDARRRADQRGIRFAALALNDAFPATTETPGSGILDPIRVMIERGHQLGAATIILASAAKLAATILRGEDTARQVIDVLRALRFDGERHGVRIAWRIAADSCIGSPAEARLLLDETNSWWVGAEIDIAAPAIGPNAPEWIAVLSYRLAAVRISDAGRPSPAALASVREALELVHFTGPVIIPPGPNPSTAWQLLDR